MPTGPEYGSAMSYENFIKRAYGYQSRNMRNGADASLMANLIDAENGKGNVRHLGSTEQQLKKVVEYIGKAIDAFLKPARKLKPEEKLKLQELKDNLTNAYSSSQLMSIVREALTITQPYK